jgi:hypothetical protein
LALPACQRPAGAAPVEPDAVRARTFVQAFERQRRECWIGGADYQAARAGVQRGASPVGGHRVGPRRAAEAVVGADHGQRAERQPGAHDGREGVQGGAQFFTLDVRRRHQQRGAHERRLARMRGPGRDELAAQAVGDQRDGGCLGGGVDDGAYDLVQPHHPVAAQGVHPVALFDAGVAVQRLPAALPVARAGALPSGQREHVQRRQRGAAGVL